MPGSRRSSTTQSYGFCDERLRARSRRTRRVVVSTSPSPIRSLIAWLWTGSSSTTSSCLTPLLDERRGPRRGPPCRSSAVDRLLQEAERAALEPAALLVEHPRRCGPGCDASPASCLSRSSSTQPSMSGRRRSSVIASGLTERASSSACVAAGRDDALEARRARHLEHASSRTSGRPRRRAARGRPARASRSRPGPCARACRGTIDVVAAGWVRAASPAASGRSPARQLAAGCGGIAPRRALRRAACRPSAGSSVNVRARPDDASRRAGRRRAGRRSRARSRGRGRCRRTCGSSSRPPAGTPRRSAAACPAGCRCRCRRPRTR